MSLKNFLPLRREVTKHWIYEDAEYFKVWVDMLFCARFSKEPKKELYKSSLYTLNYGEFLFSRITWSQRLNIKEHKLRKLIKLLEDDGMINKVGRVGSSGATIYLVLNFKSYNNHSSNMPTNNVETTNVEGDSSQPYASHTPAISQPYASDTPLKNIDKSVKKEIKHIYVFEKWNEIASHKHKEITKSINEQLNKLTEVKAKEVLIAIERYVKANDDSNYFYNNSWTLDKFIKQANGYKSWLDDGSNWVMYTDRQPKKQTNQNIVGAEKSKGAGARRPNALGG